MENIEKRNKSKLDDIIEYIIDVKKEELKLKFFFDNLRNYGISVVTVLSGLFIIKSNEVLLLNSYVDKTIGCFIILYGTLLGLLNIIQPIIILVNHSKEFRLNKIILIVLMSMILLSGIALIEAVYNLKLQ
mgnify:FL=1